jgi:glycosyltransferase involved in cell wall biosynthesis
VKVFLLSTWCPFPMVNGSTLRAWQLLRALATRHDVVLMTFAAPTSPDDAAIAHLRTFCRDVTVIPKSPFAPLRSGGVGLFSSTPRSLVETDDPAVRALVHDRAGTTDLAIGLELSAARYLAALRIPCLFEQAEPRQIANLGAQAHSIPQRLRLALTWRKHARYLTRLVRDMAAVTVVSAAERDTLVAEGVPAGKVHVVPNGADAADLTRARREVSPPRLIYPGAVTYDANLDAVRWFLAEVMPIVHAARPEVEFWVTGDIGDVPIDTLPNRHLARFTGRLPDVKAAVGDSTLAVVPLRRGGGTRLKVLEAMSLGTPVVSTSKGAEGLDVVDETDLLVGDTPEAFSAHVLRVLADPALAARLSAAGRARVASAYTWDAIGARLLDIVDDVVEGTRR